MSAEEAVLPTSPISNPDELAAREPLKAPEHLAAVDAARDPIQKPEQSAAKAPTTTTLPANTVATIPVHLSNIVAPEAFQQAEQNLAAYFSQKLNPQLTQKMQLTLSNMLADSSEGRTGGTDVKLCLSGPTIEANFAEASREIIKALQEHPVISQLLRDHPTVLIEQANNEANGQMLHLHLPNLTPEQYARLMQSLAKATTTAHVCGANCHHAQAQATEASAPALETTASAPITAPETPVKKDELVAEQPAAKVETPVVPIGKQEQITDQPQAIRA